MEELMDAIELGEEFQLLKYLDKLGYNTKYISLESINTINEDIKTYLESH